MNTNPANTAANVITDPLAPRSAVDATMLTIVWDRYGGVDTFGPRHVARPEIGDNDVLNRVVAGGVDRGV